MEPRIDQLRSFSRHWGADPRLVQGAGGNTSLKSNGRLLVKASGMRLADAETKDIFVEIELAAAQRIVDGGSLTTAGSLRPSIETSLHATMPHAVVAHLHMVDVIAFGVRRDAQEALAPSMGDLSWAVVPYQKPGVALAQTLRRLLSKQPIDVVVLGNHGVVVGGGSFEEVDAKIETLRRRLAVDPVGGNISSSALEECGQRLELEPCRFEEAHWAALDRENLAFASSGTLYPDHVVFLGRGAEVAATDHQQPKESHVLLVPGVGALLRPGLGDEAHEMAACLGAVVARIARGAPLRTLTRDEEDELINWDAERYRRELRRN
jgi:rhamnose utilization protein RhaD (predicted bifunctional aldolase and dehydrogenase)